MSEYNVKERVYIPSPTGKAFHLARDTETGFVRTIIGPFGSGKSVTCVFELLMIAMDQQADSTGKRRTKFAVIRNTYRELADTTIETFFNWIDRDSGEWSEKNMTFALNQPLSDGTTMETEFLFRALDKPGDIKKLLSLDITAAWINEVREIARPVFDIVQTRCGRYPETQYDTSHPNYHTDIDQCPILFGPTFHGVITDTNPPDSDHWYYHLFEENLPANHRIFHQPSGIAKDAENKQHLPRGYYENSMHGKTKEWINVYVHGMYGFVSDGKPVYPEYRDDMHYSPDPFKPNPLKTIFIGIDFGLTPAATFGQITSTGRMVIFDELVTFDMGAVNFGRLLKAKIDSEYKGFTFEVYGDPAGDTRSQTDEVTPYMILQNVGINAVPTYTNDFTIRREVVVDYMQRLDFTGAPAFCITPNAPTCRKAHAGGYKYKRVQVSGDDRFQDKPDKGRYSHVAESCQYLVLGAVGGDRVIGGWGKDPIDYSNFNTMVV